MEVILTLVVVVALVLWVVSIYNRLLGLRQQVRNRWKQIDVQLKRRHELVRNLLNTAGDSLKSERETVEGVVAALSRATAATGPADAANKESELTAILDRLFLLVENSALLAANHNVRALQDELTAIENTAGSARQSYNLTAMKYNTATQVVPNNIVAGFGSFSPAQLFEIKGDAERTSGDARPRDA